MLFHVADLHRRGMRAQEPVRVEIESIVHRPRRVIRGDIERLEIVIIVLDFGTVGDSEAHAREQCLEAFQRAHDRVRTTLPHTAPGQGHVHHLA